MSALRGETAEDVIEGRARYALLHGDARNELSTVRSSVAQVCVTSPPYYGMRDYGVAGQIGHEETPEEYVGEITKTMREVHRVLRGDGTLWLNLGDGYAGSGKGAWGNAVRRSANANRAKEVYVPTREEIPLAGKVPFGFKAKDLFGIPWRVALALQGVRGDSVSVVRCVGG